MSEELKPCPCGGQVYVGELRFTGETQWSVGCLHCGRAVRRSDKAEAIASWNRRASPTPPAEEDRGERAINIARAFLEHPDDGNAADFVSMGDLRIVCRALLSSPDARREALEEAAKVADEAQATAREEIAEEKAEEGYDLYAFGSGFLGGELTAAVNIAKAIRALKEKNNG